MYIIKLKLSPCGG